VHTYIAECEQIAGTEAGHAPQGRGTDSKGAHILLAALAPGEEDAIERVGLPLFLALALVDGRAHLKRASKILIKFVNLLSGNGGV
jgi:hypothetical protein